MDHPRRLSNRQVGNAHRWINGSGVLPLPAFKDDLRMIDVTAAGMIYSVTVQDRCAVAKRKSPSGVDVSI
jgi:hypothetical protein